MRLITLLTVSIIFTGKIFAIDRAELFKVPDFKELPPQTEVISEQTVDGVIVQELKFNGAPFNGSPSRIYGFYACPQAPGKYPGVVRLHGAGLKKLDSKASVFYAKNGFACLSIDWAGPRWDRTPPYSEFRSPGTIAVTVEKEKYWRTIGPEADGITNGVRFVRRSFMFLRSRPEIDSSKLFLSGMSAGAHLSLLTLGVEPDIKAAAIKYGCGYIRDFPGYFGGHYFRPLTLATKPEQNEWLAIFDPKHGILDFKASVLMLSGADDIYFLMPLVLETYRHIPTAKNLIMLPNDNHSHVDNEQIPLRYYQACMGNQPAFPKLQDPVAEQIGNKLNLRVKVEGVSALKTVSFWFKRMPSNTFTYGIDKETGVKWVSIEAENNGGFWNASLLAVQPGEQLMAYAMAEDQTGAKACSDTVEFPYFPKWRGK